jgi:SAM-dependent methyltransferase
MNPRSFGGWAARGLARLLDPIELHLAAGRRDAVPPRRLRARAGAGPVSAFLEGGRIAADELAGALSSAGRSFAEVEAVLDLGCGAGRVLPHVAQRASNARCVGCDVDGDAIDWLCHHRPEIEWRVSGATPPLPFDDATFDLVYSISVLSHLDEPQQDQWLSEVSRILRGGGVALLTTHGPYAFEQFRTGSVRTSWVPGPVFKRGPLRPDEFVFEPYERSFWNQAELPGVHTAYGLAFHGHRYVGEHWSRDLEIVAVHERAMSAWQDIVVARRRE